MYDCVRLELDASHPFDPTKVIRQKKADAPAGGPEGD
jgi:hypothetical protein